MDENKKSVKRVFIVDEDIINLLMSWDDEGLFDVFIRLQQHIENNYDEEIDNSNLNAVAFANALWLLAGKEVAE